MALKPTAGVDRSAVNADDSLVSPDGGQPPTVMDRVISSYAPTVRALHNAHAQGAGVSQAGPK